MKRSLKVNLLANFGGRGVTVLTSVIFVPLYIHYLGAEAYGLIGVYTTIYGMLTIFDMGLSATLNREFAHLSTHREKAQEQRDLLRSLEIIYWALALIIGATILAGSPLIAHNWINPGALPVSTVATAIALIGFVIVFQFPFALYQGGMMGLQEHVLLNVIVSCMSTVRAIGAIGVLAWASASIEAYFIWQCLCSLIQTLVLWWILWRKLPSHCEPPRFSRARLQSVWHFAAGMTGIAIASIILKNLDKLLLSKVLTLEEFGYYMVGAMVATSISTIVAPLFSTAFPRFSELLAADRIEDVKHLYHLLCQFSTCVVVPVVAVIALFSPNVMLIWSQNVTLVDRTNIYVSLLVIGTGMNAVLQVPYALQLAYGATGIAFYQAIVSTILYIPLLLVLVFYFGAIGGAWTWIILTSGYMLITPHIMHRRILKKEKWSWYFSDLALPTLSIIFATGGIWFIVPIERYPFLSQALVLAVTYCVSVFCGVMCAPQLRAIAYKRWRAVRVGARLESKFP